MELARWSRQALGSGYLGGAIAQGEAGEVGERTEPLGRAPVTVSLSAHPLALG